MGFVTLAFFALAPALIYPLFLMKVMCFGLFACAFNLLIGYVGLLSFGHAMFLGMAGYVAAYAAKDLGLVYGLRPVQRGSVDRHTLILSASIRNYDYVFVPVVAMKSAPSALSPEGINSSPNL